MNFKLQFCLLNFNFSLFTPLQKILPRAIAELKFTRQARAALVCERYRKLAPQIIHPEALNYTSPKFLKEKTLTINVENSAWAQLVVTRKKPLLKRLNENLGKDKITNIKTTVLGKTA